MRYDYSDLKEAIESTVFIKKKPGLQLIGGDERMPIDWIFDFRALLLQSRWLDRYAEIFWEIYGSQYPFQICGMETAAISIVAAIVMKGIQRGTPVNGLYIRKSRKRVGLLKQIEGTLDGHSVILIDDLINSGSTFNKQIKVLSEAGASVTAIFALVAFREMSAYDFLGVPVKTAFSLSDFGVPIQSDPHAIPTTVFKKVWKFESPHPLRNIVHEKSGPVIDDDKVYFGSDNGEMTALTQSSGSLAWKYRASTDEDSAIFSTPLLYRDSIVFGNGNGSIVALARKDGRPRWILKDAAERVHSTPTAAPALDMIFIGLQYSIPGHAGGVAAIDAKTGSIIWRLELPGAVHSSPLYIEKENLLMVADMLGNVMACSADKGHIRFNFAARGGVFGNLAYDSVRRTAYFGTTEGICYGIFIPTGESTFGAESLSIYSTPLIDGDTLYLSSLDKKIHAFDIATNETKWVFATQGRIFASPTLIDGSLWCGSNDGKLYELDPLNGTLRSSQQFSERIVNKIAYNARTKTFFIPTQANELYCMRK